MDSKDTGCGKISVRVTQIMPPKRVPESVHRKSAADYILHYLQKSEGPPPTHWMMITFYEKVLSLASPIDEST